MPMRKSDDELAMDSVIEDMGKAARKSKASKYEKPKLMAAEPESPAEDAGETLSDEDLEKLLANE
jgi:hypothetical protein